MVRFADGTSRQEVWNMWKSCFGDWDDYMELYFKDKYRPEDTLLFMEGSKAVASLQMLNYQFTFHGEEIPVIYLSGVCTLPEYRKRGFTRALLIEAFHEARRREVPLMILVPQERWLVELYGKYGFAQTFDEGSRTLPSLKKLMNRHEWDLGMAFAEFDGRYRKQDMTVQKTFEDFKTIVEEAALFDFPDKRSLPGMARVIDAERLLSQFLSRLKGGGQSENLLFNISVRDELLEWNNLERRADDGMGGLNVDVRDLAQLLLGYHVSAMGEPFATLFPEKSPQMHFMLE